MMLRRSFECVNRFPFGKKKGLPSAQDAIMAYTEAAIFGRGSATNAILKDVASSGFGRWLAFKNGGGLRL